ncbi:hypothetical protein KY329_01820 [Candidatus Woesearchaeota archaeon]|nr:hypothetical protein [Candidatus Woesearchaeota archaeon]
MNTSSIGLVIFAIIALTAVFSFIIVMGPPTGDYNKGIGTSTWTIESAYRACNREVNCNGGMAAQAIGYDAISNIVICECAPSNYLGQGFVFKRSLIPNA